MEGNAYLSWDIGYRNENNDTALHVAISNDADIDILRALFEMKADVNALNDDGKTPFECIRHGSWETAINILQLEKDFDLRDDNGDSFLHVLMDRVGDSVWGIRNNLDGEVEFGHPDQEQMLKKFWDFILENIDQFDINLNLQNCYGCTPLHLAADYWPSMKSLEVMLSSFKHLNPYICDEEGENFFHRYFLRHRGLYTPMFQTKMVRGKLRFLPRETISKLLNSQNNDKNTPLHILIKLGYGKAITDFEDILQGGADPNIKDWIGDTALHCIFKKYINQLEEDTGEDDEDSEFSELINDITNELIKCFVLHGADVNARNKKGESPIFLATRKEHIHTLLDLGADVNVKNNLQQTPLLYFVCKENVELDTLSNLLKSGSDVLSVDVHGNTVLHYIAWHGYHKDFLPVLKSYKITAIRDKLGQLPCDVAYMQGHKAILDDICECSDESHPNRDHLYLTSDIIQLNLLMSASREFQEKIDCIRQHTGKGENMAKVLKFPGIGAVLSEGETSEVKEVTKQIVESICKKLADKSEFLKCRIIQSGSVGENTKVSYPNEFDFVIVIEKLGEICYVDEQKSVQDQGYAYLKLKPELASEEIIKYFDDEGYLITDEVRRDFCDILDELYTNESPFNHPNISFVVGNNKAIISPTFNFTFYWKGCLYKNLLVDIDLVPACMVKNWWPAGTNIDGLEGDQETLKEQGAILLLQTEVSDKENKPQNKLRVSAMSAEKEHILHLPEIARDAYKVCKIMCDKRICPDLSIKNSRIPIKRLLTSYMLKNVVFHAINDFKTGDQSKNSEVKMSGFNKNLTLETIVKITFLKLMKFVRDEMLPSFVFPWQNVFTFNSKVLPLHNHYFCAMRYAFIKIILSIIGEVQDFSDVDEPSCMLAVRDRNKMKGMHGDASDDEDGEIGDLDFDLCHYSLL